MSLACDPLTKSMSHYYSVEVLVCWKGSSLLENLCKCLKSCFYNLATFFFSPSLFSGTEQYHSFGAYSRHLLWNLPLRKPKHESGEKKAEWDMDKVYEITKSMGKVNIELLFNKLHNAWTREHLLELAENGGGGRSKITYFLMQLVANFCHLLPKDTRGRQHWKKNIMVTGP